MDILEYLEADQDALRELIIELKTADEDSQHESETFTALVSSAKAQIDSREELFENLTGSEYASVVSILTEKLEGAREVERIIECCTNRATWRSSIIVYSEMLENTLEYESHALLPLLFGNLSLPERQKLGTRYRSLRGFGRHRSPTRRKNWSNLWNDVLTQAG